MPETTLRHQTHLFILVSSFISYKRGREGGNQVTLGL